MSSDNNTVSLLYDVSLEDIIIKYFGRKSTDFVKQGDITFTKCPIHNETHGHSLALYDKTDTNEGWDWYCFGACQRGGKAPGLLSAAGKFKTTEDAAEDIRKEWNIQLPDKVTLENFAEIKQFSLNFLKERDISEADDGVLIPYKDTHGNTVAQKKRLSYDKNKQRYTFVEGSNTLYGLDLLPTYTRDIIYIVEGETDALTMLQAGYPALGVPGNTAFKHGMEEYISDFLQIVIIPDNDEASQNLINAVKDAFPDKTFLLYMPTYNNDVSEYFVFTCNGDTEAFRKYINRQQPVPTTPESFLTAAEADPEGTIKNKSAWDTVLTNIPGKADQLIFLEQVTQTTKFKKSIVNAAYKDATSRQSTTDTDDTDIFVENNAYWKWSFPGGVPKQVRVTNFIMKLLYTIVDSDGNYTRVFKLINTDGRISRPLELTGEDLSNYINFSAACKNVGPFLFEGDNRDLTGINKLIFRENEHLVHSPNYIGKVEGNFVFGDIAINDTGGIIHADDSGLLNMGDKSYLPRGINLQDDTAGFPSFPEDGLLVSDDYRKKLAYNLYNNLGGYEAWLALGWAVAGWYSNDIFKHQGDRSYPILFVAGKRSSGKTVLSQWLMEMFGFNDSHGKSFAGPTIVGMTRKLGYYSSLPVWYDDFRNNIRDIHTRSEFLLGVYNRQGADKGVRAGFGIRSEAIKGYVLLSGEDTPADNALLSRCAVIHVSEYTRDQEYLPAIQEMEENFPRLGLTFARQAQQHGSTALLKQLTKLKEMFINEGVDGRVAKVYATLGAGFLQGYRDVISNDDIDDFLSWLTDYVKTGKQAMEKEHIVNVFLDDLAVMISRGDIAQHVDYTVEDGNLYLWYKKVYDAWATYLRTVGREPITRTVLLDYIRKEPFFVDDKVSKWYKRRQANSRSLVLEINGLGEELANECQSLMSGYVSSNAEF